VDDYLSKWFGLIFEVDQQAFAETGLYKAIGMAIEASSHLVVTSWHSAPMVTQRQRVFARDERIGWR